MREPVFNIESSEELSAPDDTPQFGLVDVIEAFTAMRHELRGQSKESRTAVESVQIAVETIQSLEEKLLIQTAASNTDQARKLADAIADFDHQLSRAVAAVTQFEARRRRREQSELEAVQRHFEQSSAVARWLARPLLELVIQQRRSLQETAENPAVEGLNLLLARLRRMMKEHQIQRFDTLGQEFDAETMNAIGTVESGEHASGYVAEQLSPGYRWRGSLLRFADVRVAS